MPFFYCFVKRFFVEYISMKNIRALLIDCDGVLYYRSEYTDDDIVRLALGKTLAQYHISQDEFDQARTSLKEEGIRGLFNAALEICNHHHIAFNDFAVTMTNNTDYNNIAQDLEMLELLKKVGTLIPTYIVTNNTLPHLVKIFDQLRGKQASKSLQEELSLNLITIETTSAFDHEFNRTIFHPKQMKEQFKKLCAQMDLPPETVALIDDTERIRKKAKEQGLITIPTEGPKDTKDILRRIIHEKAK